MLSVADANIYVDKSSDCNVFTINRYLQQQYSRPLT